MLASVGHRALLLLSMINRDGIFQYTETVSLQFSLKITETQENRDEPKNSILIHFLGFLSENYLL